MLWPLLAAVLVVSWSSGFVGIRYASEHASVVLVLFWRLLFAGALLLPVALLSGTLPSRHAIARQAGFGVMAVFLYLGGFALAIGQRVPTGLVALISDLVPLAIAALSQPILGERLHWRQWAGSAVAVGGVLLVSRESLSVGTAPLWAYILTVASMLTFALTTVLQKRLGAIRMPIAQSLCIQFLTGGMLFGLCAAWQGPIAPPADRNFAVGIAWLVLFSTFVCYAVYYTSLRLYPAAQVSAVIYLSPPVTMLWGWVLFNEPLSIVTFQGLGVTLLGVLMTSMPGASRSASRHIARAGSSARGSR
jgi:drug/metabolite transporter (DMT)-like permease